MKFIYALSLIAVAQAAYVPSEPWTVLTPTATFGSDVPATSSLSGSYALSLKTVSAASASTSATVAVSKRDDEEDGGLVTQIDDGQLQQHTDAPAVTMASVVNQIDDGQIQQQTAADVVNQIDDGQIQQQTAADVVNQIDDGQIQQQTAADVVNQIDDGQIQQQTAADVINQIDDGQVQQQTATADVANQIDDGQIQQQTSTVAAASQIDDGQVQGATDVAEQEDDGQVDENGNSFTSVCVPKDSLLLELKDGVLTDTKGRIGSIVANRQFQFDGPPPQAGAIYAKGWSVVPINYKEDSETKQKADDEEKEKREEGFKLALGKQTIFYKCLSGDFYNLYDESIGGQCSEVEFVLMEAETC